MHYQFGPCTEADRKWAYALKSEAYREVVERQFGPCDETFQHKLFNARWNPTLSSIVLVGDEAAGTIAVEERGEERWLDEIQLVRAWCGRGLGRTIIQDIIGRTRADCMTLKLQVLRQNLRAQSLSCRLGFSITGETKTHILMETGSTAPERPS